MTFAAKLQAVRRREGISQTAAAALIRDFSVRALQAWEQGQQTPPLWTQWLVMEALGGAPNPARGAKGGRPRKAKDKAK